MVLQIFIGVAAVVVFLAAWTEGLLLGRIMAFLLLSVLFGWGLWLWGDTLIDPNHLHRDGNSAWALVGIALAWPVSGIPIYRENAAKRRARRQAKERWGV